MELAGSKTHLKQERKDKERAIKNTLNDNVLSCSIEKDVI
jgi:hypothetical protein